MSPKIPPSPRSSSAFEPRIVLKPRASRRLVYWWLALHALLAAAVVLVAAPVWLKAVASIAIAGHVVARWPAEPPGRLVLGPDGQLEAAGCEPTRLSPKARFTRSWARLVGSSGAVDLLLLQDQLSPAEWARLSAWLRQTRLDERGHGAGKRVQTPDLR